MGQTERVTHTRTPAHAHTGAHRTGEAAGAGRSPVAHGPVEGGPPGSLTEAGRVDPVRLLGLVVMKQVHLHRTRHIQYFCTRYTCTKHNTYTTSALGTPAPNTIPTVRLH